MNKIFTFFNEVKGEVKKITWPGRDELVGSVMIVCILVIVFAAILGTMDTVFGALVKRIINLS